MTYELEHLRNFATAARRGGFSVPLFKLDGNSGEYRRTGKNNTAVMNGQKLACDPVDAMTGWQRFIDNRPVYQLGRIADGFTPAAREELGDLPDPGNKDSWIRVDFLPFWNRESREILLFSAANQGSRDAVASLVGAYADNLAAHPEDQSKVPLVELMTDSYQNNHGKQIFVPIFEIVGWIERPTAVRRILPPPVQMLELTAMPTAELASPPSDTIPAKSDQSAPAVANPKPKKLGAGGRVPNMDEEIPFAPEWRG